MQGRPGGQAQAQPTSPAWSQVGCTVKTERVRGQPPGEGERQRLEAVREGALRLLQPSRLSGSSELTVLCTESYFYCKKLRRRRGIRRGGRLVHKQFNCSLQLNYERQLNYEAPIPVEGTALASQLTAVQLLTLGHLHEVSRRLRRVRVWAVRL